MNKSTIERWWTTAAFWLPIVAFLPPLLMQLWATWNDRPVRISLVAIPLLALLVVWNPKADSAKSLGRQRWAMGLLLFGLISGILSGWFMAMPWYFLSGLICLLGWKLGSSNRAWPSLAAPLGLLAVALPWPLGVFKSLNESLYRASAWFLSNILDGLGILHVRVGRTIELPEFQLLIDDRLHGLDGLLPLMMLALLIAYWKSRSLVHALLLCLSSIFVFALGLVVCGLIAVLVFHGYEKTLMDQTSSRYGLSGGILLVQAIFLLANDAALARFLKSVPSRSFGNDITTTTFDFYNRVLAWPGEVEVEEFDDDEFESDAAADPSTTSEETVSSDFEEEFAPANWSWKPSYRGLVGASVALTCIGLLLTLALASRDFVKEVAVGRDEIANVFPKGRDMPDEIEGKKLTSYSEADRIWKYEGVDSVATLHLVYPVSQKELWRKDIATEGWKVKGREYSAPLRTATTNPDDNWSWELQIGESEDYGYLYEWHCGLSEDLVPLRHGFAQTIVERFFQRLGVNIFNQLLSSGKSRSAIEVDVQMETGESMDLAQLDEAKKWFQVARGALKSSLERTSVSGKKTN